MQQLASNRSDKIWTDWLGVATLPTVVFLRIRYAENGGYGVSTQCESWAQEGENKTMGNYGGRSIP